MGLLQRLGEGLKALLAPAEDPRQTYATDRQRLHALLALIQRGLAQISVSKDRVASQATRLHTRLPQLEAEARRALAAGHEDLARLTLRRRQVALLELQGLEGHLRELAREEDRLRHIQHRLATEIEAWDARRETIDAQHRAVAAQVHLTDTLAGASREFATLGLALERAEQRASQMRAQADALGELVEASLPSGAPLGSADPLASRFQRLELLAAVEAELAAIKRELAAGEDTRCRPDGDPPSRVPGDA